MARKKGPPARTPVDRRSLALDALTEAIGPYTAFRRRQVAEGDDPLAEWSHLPLTQGEVRACFRDWGIGDTDWSMTPDHTKQRVVAGVRIVGAVARAAQVLVFGACRATVPEDLKSRAAALLASVALTYDRSLRDKRGFLREHNRLAMLCAASDALPSVERVIHDARAHLSENPSDADDEGWRSSVLDAIKRAANAPARRGGLPAFEDLRLDSREMDRTIAVRAAARLFRVAQQDLGPGVPRKRWR